MTPRELQKCARRRAWGRAWWLTVALLGAFSGGWPVPADESASSLVPSAVVVDGLSHYPETVTNATSFQRATEDGWSMESRVPDARFGSVVRAAGDMDGDGSPDVVVGSRSVDGAGDRRRGGVFLLSRFGSATAAPLIQFIRGLTGAASFGTSVASPGDVNGDGLRDLIVGAPKFAGSAGENGAWFAQLQRPPGQFSQSRTFALKVGEDTRFGSEVCAVGDLDRDGLADFVVAARRYTSNAVAQGAIFLFRGSPSGPVLDPMSTVYGDVPGCELGGSLAAADVNGDGQADLLAGADGPLDGTNRLGAVWIFHGSTRGYRNPPARILAGPAPRANFGWSVANAGDLDRDGFDDVIVGAPGPPAPQTFGGMALLYRGSRDGLIPIPVWTVYGRAPDDRCGAAVAGAGDVDGDGWRDVLVSSTGYGDNERRACGCVALYRGSPDGLERVPSWVAAAAHRLSRYGSALGGLGDVNGDRLADFAIGSRTFPDNGLRCGRLDIFYGSTNRFKKVAVAGADAPWARDVQLRFSKAVDKPLSWTSGGLASNKIPELAGMQNGPVEPQAGALDRAKLPATAPVAGARAFPRHVWNAWDAGCVVLGGLVLLTGFGWWSRKAQRLAARRERERMMRDVHDGVGAQLSRAQAVIASAAGGSGGSGAPDLGTVHPAMAALEAANASVREWMWAAGCGDSLEELVSFLGESGAQFFARTGIRFRPDLPVRLPNRSLDPEAKNNLVLLVREAFGNVLKHAQAGEVQLTVRLEGDSLTIRIADDGVGLPNPRAGASLPVAPRRDGSGNGLPGMEARAGALGGTFSISAGPHGGTEVTVRMPLPAR